MAILENRVKRFKKGKAKAYSILSIRYSTILSIPLFILALILIFNSNFLKLNSHLVQINGILYEKAVEPTKKIFANSINFVINITNFSKLHVQNTYLEQENEKLSKQVKKSLILKAENKKLKETINLAEPEGEKHLMSQILFTSSSNIEDLAVIAAGSKDGVKENDIVTSNGFLAGRIVTVGKNYSKVLLINSYKSRIPVKTYSTGLDAILVGNAEKGVYLLHMHGRQKPKTGELIITSGDGLYFPRGVPVARVTEVVGENVKISLVNKFSSSDLVEIIAPDKFYN